MEPTSAVVLVLVALAAVALPVGTVLAYRQQRRFGRRFVPVLVGLVVASQLTAVGAVAVGVNRQFGFYPTWSALFGQDGSTPPVAMNGLGGLGVGSAAMHVGRPTVHGLVEPASNLGRYEQVTIVGGISRIRQTVSAWLPPQYADRRDRAVRFPVVMVLGGAYSGSSSVYSKLDFAQLASAAIRSGKVAPFVAIYPQLNVALPTDTECVDFPNGLQSYTWLAKDVPAWTKAHLRVSTDGRQWSVMGWSTGGYCAAKLQLRSPQQFAAGASIEGYFAPEPDGTTADLAQVLQANPVLARENTLSWVLLHQPPAHVHVLVCTSLADPQSKASSLAFLKTARNVPGVQPYILANLGHSMAAYKDVTPNVLAWLADVAAA